LNAGLSRRYSSAHEAPLALDVRVRVVLALFVTAFAARVRGPHDLHRGRVRTKSVGPFTAKVYSIRHDMKEKPATSRSRRSSTRRRQEFTWRMLRDVDSKKIQKGALRGPRHERLQGRRPHRQFVGAFDKEEVKENSAVVISYNATAKTVTIWVQKRQDCNDRRCGLHEGRLEHLARKDRPAGDGRPAHLEALKETSSAPATGSLITPP